MKIRTKLLLIVVLATSLIGVAALSGIVASANLVESQAKEKYMALSTYAMEKVHRLFARRFEDLARLAQDPVMESQRSTSRQISDRLKEYKRHFDSYLPYTSLSFFDLSGKWLAGTEGMDEGARLVFPTSVSALTLDRAFFVEESRRDLQHRPRTFHLARVVYDTNSMPIGFVVANLSARSLQEIVGRPLGMFKINGSFNVDLLDGKGSILFSTRDTTHVLRNVSPLYDVVRHARTGNAAGTVLLRAGPGTEDREIVVFARDAGDATFPGRGWTLAVSLPEHAALAPFIALKNRLALVFIAIGAIAVGMVLLLSRTITGPLERLHRAITEVERGNLDAAVEVSSADEIGRLSAVFNGMVAELKESHGRLRTAASMDALTGAFNRKGIDDVLRREVERARRAGSSLSLVLFDLDHFKEINDSYGHLGGDRILKTVIGVIRESIRRSDPLGRWGGEEFMLLTPGTGLEEAADLAEKIRERIEGFPFPGVGAVTISCGVATLTEGDACTDLIKRADDALYRAKDKGRNAVEVVG